MSSFTSDVDWIRLLSSVLPANDRAALLQHLVATLVPIASREAGLSGDPDDLAEEYVRERLGHSKSATFAAELVAMNRENDADFDEWLLSDDRERLLLVPDAELAAAGETLLKRYLGYRQNYPERGTIHPSDYSGPREDDEALEWQRNSSDFAYLARDWRDGFLAQLMADVAKAEANSR